MKKTIIILLIAITTIGCTQRQKTKIVDKSKQYPDTIYLMFYDDYRTMTKIYCKGRNKKDTTFIHYTYTLPSGSIDGFMSYKHKVGKHSITYMKLDYFYSKGIEIKDPLWNINKYNNDEDYFWHNKDTRKFYIIEVDLRKNLLKKIEVVPNFHIRV